MTFTAFPEHVTINPREDVVMNFDTSGSTGKPKAVLYSHFNAIASFYGGRGFFEYGNSMMSCSINFGALAIIVCMESLYFGGTVYVNTAFNRETHFELLRKYKPSTVIMYPYNAVWMARSPQLKSHDLSFLKAIYATASVLDPATVKILNEELPNVAIEQVVDVETGRTLPVGQRGEILVKSPSMMMGYNKDGKQVCPSEIEALLQEHEAVQAAGVVAIPNAATDNLARAFVVLRPGCHVTADELQVHVAAKLIHYKHLHGGVRFVDTLPVNRNNKLDRGALKKIALAEIRQ
ncbi:hypothetical protein B566_EDAN007414 [Ephemera danica]|nr:hypothetical protein B566_EDAN007414 [Ephemera danica]